MGNHDSYSDRWARPTFSLNVEPGTLNFRIRSLRCSLLGHSVVPFPGSMNSGLAGR